MRAPRSEMANTWFEFRQFRIEQGACAMKVSTDACLFGAWAPFSADARTILDVGTGTGLLALMLAQRFPQAQITGLELDPAAAAQARANVEESPFRDRIEILEADARFWRPGRSYDALMCNPPFFHRSLQGPDAARNAARHSDSFDLHELLDLMEAVLAPDGQACVLLPADRREAWQDLLRRRHWNPEASMYIRPTAQKGPNRWMGRCGKKVTNEGAAGSLIIYETPGVYAPAARALLQPFYKKLL